jgi:SAM-dependent methyltransferase
MKKMFIKHMHDGRSMLNIGCGVRTHRKWNNMDFSPYARLAHHKQWAKFLNCIGILSSARHQNILKIDPDIIYWDIRKGLLFDDNVFDVIYHSHFITHLDRDMALYATCECLRTLKPGGTIRVVVPDLRQIVNLYNEATAGMENNDNDSVKKHEYAVNELFELMVRRDAFGTTKQNTFVRKIEHLIRSGIDTRGELRRWHYDKYSMAAMLKNAGFRDACAVDAAKSRIEGWNVFGLDLNEDGVIYKHGSLYMEAVK